MIPKIKPQPSPPAQYWLLSERLTIFDISPVASLALILYKKRTTKGLIRQSRSAGWSAPLLFATLRRQVFSHRGPYNVYVLPIMTQMGPLATHMSFPTWFHVPLQQIPYRSHLEYYGTHIISRINEKSVCHTLLTVMFNQRIIKAIHVLLIHGF